MPEKIFNPANFPYEIVDAHHHLWDLDAVNYPWLSATGVIRFFGDPAPIQKDYLVADLQEDIGDLPVIKSVHIEVGAAEGQHFLESKTIQSMADQSRFANGIVAFAHLQASDIIEQLDALSELENLRGIRQIVGRSPAEDKATGTGSLIDDPKWLEGLQELARRGLSFDLQLIPDQMQNVVAVLEQVPELNVALCHCGSPWYRDDKGWNMWRQGLKNIAALPNSMCKVSGLSMFDNNWTVESLKPVIEEVVSTFGPERVMFGSNFPVDKLHTSYQRLWRAYLQIVEQLPELVVKQKQAMFRDNCMRFYRL